MAMQDANLLLSQNQAITATAPSTNVLDFLVARDIGAGNVVMITVSVRTAFTAAGAATMQISWQGSTDNTNWFDLIMSPVIPKADLIVTSKGIWGFVVPRKSPNLVGSDNTATPARYFRLNYTVATGPMTAGNIDAWMTAWDDQDQYFTYARNYTI